MIDISLIREQPETVKAGIARKGADTSLVDQVAATDSERRTLLRTAEDEQATLNRLSKEMASLTPEERDAKRAELKTLSDAVKAKRDRVAELDAQLLTLMRQIPNLPAADVPEGKSDAENVVIRTVGSKREFDFPVQDHEVLATRLGLLDLERGAKVSGAKFYYLKDELVILEQAVIRFALDLLRAKGFTPMTVPDLVRAEAMYGAGHFATPEDATDGDAYALPRDELFLAGTAEVGLAAYHTDEILPEAELPRRYAGFSACFRREAGTYGREARGLYRVHQFHKVEMFAYVRPEDSEAEHAALLAIAEDILQKLDLPYQVVLNCGGDLGLPQYKKWDIETWMPGLGKYGETHSCSNDTDYQARSLGMRYRRESDGEVAYLYTLNNTAVASPRILIPILENYQQADGSISVPEVLIPYTGFSRIGGEPGK